MYYFRLEINDNGLVTIDSNLNKVDIGGYAAYIKEKVDETQLDIFEFMKRNHGIAVKNDGNTIRLINDPFSSIPVYVYNSRNNFVVDTVFENFIGLPVTIDKIGCYESLMYSSGLFDRTAFCEIKNMPAACEAMYDLNTRDLTIESYWDYFFPCNETITDEDAIKSVWETLCGIYGNYENKDVLMGMSGGLDSRLSICLLSQFIERKHIKTFTFGHHKSIKDYELAKDTCKRLGISTPVFVHLDGNSYKSSLDLPIKTGGGVGIAHCHTYRCLQEICIEGKTLISNYYSDGVMGYDCRPDDAKTIYESDYYKILKENYWNAPQDILDKIFIDLEKVANRRRKKDNYSGFNEYIYLTERNPKFHNKLSYLYSELLDVETPFTEYELLKEVLSLPQKYRYHKRIEKMVLEKKLGVFEDISSSRYAGIETRENNLKGNLCYNIKFLNMLIINRINAVLNLCFMGRIQIPNRYITENHLSIFDRYFSKEKEMADKYAREILGIKKERNPLQRRNLRTADAGKGFEMIGLVQLLKAFSL